MDTQALLTLIGIIGTAVLVVWAIYHFTQQINKTIPSSEPLITKVPRSWPAGQICVEFYALPPNHRPSIDVDAVVNALDTKYGIEDVNAHFKGNVITADRRWTTAFTWNHNTCNSNPVCPFADYTRLHEQIELVTVAYKKQQHALAVAEQQHGFEQMREMLDGLRDEAQSLDESTADIEKGNSMP